VVEGRDIKILGGMERIDFSRMRNEIQNLRGREAQRGREIVWKGNEGHVVCNGIKKVQIVGLSGNNEVTSVENSELEHIRDVGE